jgi:hypothetical protein
MKNIFILCGFLSITAADNSQHLEETIELARMEHFFLVPALNGELDLRLYDYQELVANSNMYIPQELLLTKDEAIYFLQEYLLEEHFSLAEADVHDLIQTVIGKVYVGSTHVMMHTRLLRLLHVELMAQAQKNVAAVAAAFNDEEHIEPIYDMTGDGCLVHESSCVEVTKYEIKKCPLTRKSLLQEPLFVHDIIEHLLMLKKKKDVQADHLSVEDFITRDVISLNSFLIQDHAVERLRLLLHPPIDEAIFSQHVIACHAKRAGFTNLEKLIQSLQQPK